MSEKSNKVSKAAEFEKDLLYLIIRAVGKRLQPSENESDPMELALINQYNRCFGHDNKNLCFTIHDDNEILRYSLEGLQHMGYDGDILDDSLLDTIAYQQKRFESSFKKHNDREREKMEKERKQLEKQAQKI